MNYTDAKTFRLRKQLSLFGGLVAKSPNPHCANRSRGSTKFSLINHLLISLGCRTSHNQAKLLRTVQPARPARRDKWSTRTQETRACRNGSPETQVKG